ncbi:FAD-dependent oxidoreductase [Mesorhizobium qingshengii]|uniref:FAD-dependent oxidoreductase n=1 Tax=Mesorhizobium qingshengii TaxID=1165689 RepID=A0ABT4R3E1_9HYPH|nr:FAD-dependent oxidoreductase [Mesorhizobium qingshengii]MCZ8548348.1 FAD-dependent oxidoreductase [Mesorhizobium qingshengii]
MRPPRTISIVGGGHAAAQVVASLREEGYDGRLVLFNAEPQLPYHRPPLSKDFLKSAEPQLKLIRSQAFYQTAGVDLAIGRSVTAIDAGARRLVLAGGTSHSFDAVVLCTGARPRRPALEGTHLRGVMSLRNAEDALGIRSRIAAGSSVVILGGGFIGLEISAVLSELGLSVTIVEAADRVLAPAVAPEIGRFLEHLQRSWGVDIRLNSGANRLLGSDAVEAVELADGEILPAEMVIVAAGCDPNVDLAVAAGLACADGVLVDRSMRTSRLGILAAGDCVRGPRAGIADPIRLGSVQSAMEQARIAARTVVAKATPDQAVPWFWSDQRGTKLLMAGLAAGATREVVRGNVEEGRFSVFLFKDEHLAAIHSVNAASDHMAARRALAANLLITPDQVRDPAFDLQAWSQGDRDGGRSIQ